jgi:hypothetical protein
MHAFIAFDTLRKCKGHILGTLTPAQYRDVRRDIVSLILATDLQQHFEVSCTACLSATLLDYTQQQQTSHRGMHQVGRDFDVTNARGRAPVPA